MKMAADGDGTDGEDEGGCSWIWLAWLWPKMAGNKSSGRPGSTTQWGLKVGDKAVAWHSFGMMRSSNKTKQNKNLDLAAAHLRGPSRSHRCLSWFHLRQFQSDSKPVHLLRLGSRSVFFGVLHPRDRGLQIWFFRSRIFFRSQENNRVEIRIEEKSRLRIRILGSHLDYRQRRSFFYEHHNFIDRGGEHRSRPLLPHRGHCRRSSGCSVEKTTSLSVLLQISRRYRYFEI
ncbi:hypothetical protein Droror1_Dr00001716 [Drosera rotundifolia]